MRSITLIVFVLLLVGSMLVGPIEAWSQVSTGKNLQVGVRLGTRGTTILESNLFDERIARFERKSNQVFFSVMYQKDSYQKNSRFALWGKYADGFTDESFILAGADRLSKSVALGGQINTGKYSASFEYGYLTFQDSLYQDNLKLGQRFHLANGVMPGVISWIGVGNGDRLEWGIEAGVVFPVAQQLNLEPLFILSKNGFESEAQQLIGLKAGISLFEKGTLNAGFSKFLNAQERKGVIALFSCTVPFMQHHALASVQRSYVGFNRTTLVAVGMNLGLGRQR